MGTSRQSFFVFRARKSSSRGARTREIDFSKLQGVTARSQGVPCGHVVITE